MVPNLITRALNPCFIFRPDIFLRACCRKVRPRPERYLVTTAWGDPLEVNPRKFIGAHLYMRGVHELAVCEILWRLASPGDHVVDVGANIGVMTSLLSKRIGPRGRVYAFEPHPRLYGCLERNTRRWHRGNIVPSALAASAQNGSARLFENHSFQSNDGTAAIDNHADAKKCFETQTVRLDDALPPRNYALCKIDVEGHEFPVLFGARQLLASHRVRDLVFESTRHYPGPAHELLLDLGYRLFEILGRFSAPALVEVRQRLGGQGGSSDYLATLDPVRAQRLIGSSGWKVLRKPEKSKGLCFAHK